MRSLVQIKYSPEDPGGEGFDRREASAGYRCSYFDLGPRVYSYVSPLDICQLLVLVPLQPNDG